MRKAGNIRDLKQTGRQHDADACLYNNIRDLVEKENLCIRKSSRGVKNVVSMASQRLLRLFHNTNISSRDNWYYKLRNVFNQQLSFTIIYSKEFALATTVALLQ
jgi:hypothetical protein